MGNMVLAAASYTKAITSLKSVLLTLGSAIGAGSFALFFGGALSDGIFAAIFAILICFLKKYFKFVCFTCSCTRAIYA